VTQQLKIDKKQLKKFKTLNLKLDLLLVHHKQVVMVLLLTGASTMIYYSNGYDLEKRQQSEARIDRIGQEKPMTYVDIIAEGTIDEKIVKALA
jgi:SNF2 family DNA or RNA helicase